MFFAADHVELIDPQPAAIGTPWAGDVHAEGNPHLHTDPRKLLQVADALAERLQQEAPAQRAAIEQRRQAFAAQWQARIEDEAGVRLAPWLNGPRHVEVFEPCA